LARPREETVMRRRERYRGLVWLRSLPDDPAEGRITPRLPHVGSLDSAMVWLLVVARRLVEFDQEGEVYDVRVYPRPGIRTPGLPAVAIAYRGSDLRSILWQAVDDLTELGNRFSEAELQDREVVRWVS